MNPWVQFTGPNKPDMVLHDSGHGSVGFSLLARVQAMGNRGRNIRRSRSGDQGHLIVGYIVSSKL